jgi:hypothetical protein
MIALARKREWLMFKDDMGQVHNSILFVPSGEGDESRRHFRPESMGRLMLFLLINQSVVLIYVSGSVVSEMAKVDSLSVQERTLFAFDRCRHDIYPPADVRTERLDRIA